MVTTPDNGVVEEAIGVPEFVTTDHGSYRDSVHVCRWGQIDYDAPLPLIDRKDLHPGDLIRSSFGYAIYVTRVKYRVTNHHGQGVWIEGKIGSANGTKAQPENGSGSVPLVARGGVNFITAFKLTGETPKVPITEEERTRSHIDVDGRTIDRKLA